MEASEYKNIFDHEASHFFYVANHQLVLKLIGQFFQSKTKEWPKILDAGCGTGLLSKKLKTFGDVAAVDISPHALKFAIRRGIKAVKASVTKLPFKDNTFDILICLDVICHKSIKDDRKALGEFFRVLKPGGIAIIRVPANKWLAFSHDAVVHTRERYERKEFALKLASCGFTIERLSFINALLLPAAILRSIFEKVVPPKKQTSAIWHVPSLINKIIAALLVIENNIFPSLPLGLGLIAVCRKPREVKGRLESLSAVFPAYNDERAIPTIVRKTARLLPLLADKFEIIVVNDGSEDGTARVLEDLQEKIPFLKVVTHEKNQGYGAALRSGFNASSLKFIFYTDGDGQYDVGELPKLVSALDSDVDIVTGFKLNRKDPWARKAAGFLYNQFVKIVLDLPVKDVDCDFRLFKKELLRGINFRIGSGAFDAEFIKKLTKKNACFRQIAVAHYPRKYGQSQFFSPRRIARTIWDVGLLWFRG